MVNVALGRVTAADWTLLDFREVVGDNAAELVFFRSAVHEPVAVDAEDVETVEAVVNSDQVNSIGEGLSL